jgi:ubiquinone/menaquinone biosynthesis C-methylase UbiE
MRETDSTGAVSLSSVDFRTATLYGKLWPRYGDDLFSESVDLFAARWLANGEDPDFFRDKVCLDVGCGGGRYSFAMSRMGARSVVGIDLSETGLADARKRSEAFPPGNVRFMHASALELPFPDEQFDFVCCSGVLHHTPCVEKGLQEIYRVLKPGGFTYLLLYGAGGLFWPLNDLLRPLAALLGEQYLEKALDIMSCAANKRRVLLDDTFTPILERYSKERVEQLLKSAGFCGWRRWNSAQLDHESNAAVLIEEMEERGRLYGTEVCPSNPQNAAIQLHCSNICRSVIAAARELERQCQSGHITEEELRAALIGEGHHRIIAERSLRGTLGHPA